MSGPKKTFKKDRFEGRILQEVNAILRTRMSDTRLQFVSITKVELSADYSIADIYWDTFDAGSRTGAKDAIAKVHGKIRSMLAQILNVRHTPQLNFHYDSQYESEQSIERILEEEVRLGKNY